MVTRFYLAELNVARTLYPLDDPRMAEFVANLAVINELAERSPGFVWRLQDDAGGSTSVRLFDDPLLLVNFSIWLSPEALFDYVYGGGHLDFWKRRREWFSPSDLPQTVMWWMPTDELPAMKEAPLQEATIRLERLRRDGPTTEAFNFKQRFPAPQE